MEAADIKSYLLMAFQGLEYLHSNWILHRVWPCLYAWLASTADAHGTGDMRVRERVCMCAYACVYAWVL